MQNSIKLLMSSCNDNESNSDKNSGFISNNLSRKTSEEIYKKSP